MWKIEVYSKGVDISLTELRAIGTNLGIRFPLDYEMFVFMGMTGTSLHSNTFLIRPEMGNATLTQFFDPRRMAEEISNAPHFYEDDLIPIALEGTGDEVCFSRNSSGVYYVAHEYLDDPERARTLLAETWSDFLEKIEPYEG